MPRRTKKDLPRTDPRPTVVVPTTGLEIRKLRGRYKLDSQTFSRMIGSPEAVLVRWEEDSELPGAEVAARAVKVAKLLGGLSRVMRGSFIATWLRTPSDACKQAGAH